MNAHRRRRSARVALSLVAVVAAFASRAAGPAPEPAAACYDVAVGPSGADRFAAAEYHLWVPEGRGPLLGVIVRQHGCGNGATAPGHSLAHDPEWQALARKRRCALLSTRMLPGSVCEDWADPKNGSGDALLSALRRLASGSGHPKLATAPWALCSHSGGGYWAASMAYRYPERTLVAVPARCLLPVRDGRKATVLPWMNGLPAGDPPPAVAAVPVLWAPGGKDGFVNEKDDPRDLYARSTGSPWGLAIALQAGHEMGELRTFVLPYLDAVLSLRLPRRPGDPPLPIGVDKGWLGNVRTGEVAPAAAFRGDPRASVWLPDEPTARLWNEYSATGAVAPPPVPGQPPPPRNVRAARTPAGIRITWEPQARPGELLPAFHLYRDGTLLATVAPPGHGYGDEPRPLLWRTEFVDATAAASDRDSGGVYSVAAVAGNSESARVRAPFAAPRERRPGSPDLVVTDVLWSPEHPAPGEPVKVRAVLQNRGDSPAPPGVPVSVAFRIGGQDLIGAYTVGPLSLDATVTLEARTVPTEKVWKALPGEHEVTAEADELHRIAEADEANNTARGRMSVSAAAAGLPQ